MYKCVHKITYRCLHVCEICEMEIMCSSQTMGRSIPVIDLSKEKLMSSCTSCWSSTSNDVRRALEEHGCFIAECKEASLELRDAIFHSSEALFDLPMEAKVQNTSNKLGYGHGVGYPKMPLFEALGIENAATLEGTQTFVDQLWPQGNDRFRDMALSYSEQLSQLEQRVVQMLFQSYGFVDKYFDSHVESTTYLMRFIKYRVPCEKEINTGLVAHTDKSFLAILDQNEVEGLEIQNTEGEWAGVGLLPPTSFIVIAGEAFMAWSNGKIRAPFHRVVTDGKKDRYTVGLFSFSRGTVRIPEELADDDHPMQFRPFDHFSFLNYCGEVGMKIKYPIKAYCGV